MMVEMWNAAFDPRANSEVEGTPETGLTFRLITLMGYRLLNSNLPWPRSRQRVHLSASGKVKLENRFKLNAD